MVRDPLKDERDSLRKHEEQDRQEKTPDKSDADRAYARAQEKIAQALKTGATELDLSGSRFGAAALNALDRLPPELAEAIALQSLDLRDTQVTDLTPLQSLTALQSLTLRDTKVTDLTPLQSLTALQSLDLSFTQVTDFTPLQSLTALQSLDLGGTQVTDLTLLQSLTALQSLSLRNTQVTDFTPLQSLTALQSLNLGGTQVTDLTLLQSLTALQILLLWDTQVTDLTPLQSLTALQRLTLWDTQVTDFTPLQSLTALQRLDLERTPLTDLTPLQRLTALQILDLGDTQVTDITPLQSLTALQSLNLRNTQVTDLTPLQSLTALQSLDLRVTQVTDLRPIRNLPQMDRVGRTRDGFGIGYVNGLFFEGTEATRRDPELARLSAIDDDAERTQATLAYLRGLTDWPPLPESNPEQDALLPLVDTDQGYDLAAAHPDPAETADPVKQKAHNRLRKAAAALAQAAGNRYYRLADSARALCTALEPELADLDMLDIHFELEDLRGTYERRGERTGEDAYTADVVDALDKVLMVGPGLTLDNAEVQKLEDRRDRYRGTAPDPQVLARQDDLSRSIVDAPETFGPRIRALETHAQSAATDQMDRLRIAQETANRNTIIKVGTATAVAISSGALGQLGVRGLDWLLANGELITQLAPHFGTAFEAWITPILMRAREAWAAVNSRLGP